MTSDKQKEEYIAELKNVVEKYPRNFVGYINCKGFLGRRPNRQYLRDFIEEQTPLLNDPKYKISTKLFWIFNGITSWEDPRVCCQQCKKPLVDKNVFSIGEGYPRFCCRRCQYDSPDVREQTVQTCLKKYGVVNSFLIPVVIQHIHDVKDEIQKKRDETKRVNYTFKESSNEQKAGEFLKQLYPDLEIQYKSDKYPFNCDFYSPSNELYMEFNGLWTPGGRFYNPDDASCQEQLKKWNEKAKTSNFYINAIETWTVRDVAKRKFATENHLNYVVFWTIQEVIKYLNDRGVFVDYNTKGRRTPVSIQSAMEFCKLYSFHAFSKYQTEKFPYPEISEKQIDWEIKALSTRMLSDKQFSPIIRKYHQSIWNCSKEGQLSPTAFWEKFKGVPKEKWDKFYTNRLVHAGIGVVDEEFNLKPKAIEYGFEVLRYSNCVSYLKPFLAKRLLLKYLPNASEIFCPMNGFSGLFLGTVLGTSSRYIAKDINPIQIQEAKDISEMLIEKGVISKDSVSLSVNDMFEDSGSYECLVACPPYSLKERWNFDADGNCIDKDLSCEQWIKEMLSRYSCRKYLFVIDGEENTEFDDHIVETLSNRSHFGENCEKVILI